MTAAQRKSPQTLERLRAHIEETTEETSAMNMPKKPKNVKTPAPVRLMGPVEPELLESLYNRLEQVYANMDALGKVFGLIADQSTEFDVVQPLAAAGELLATNVADAVNGVLLRLGTYSGQLVLAGVA